MNGSGRLRNLYAAGMMAFGAVCFGCMAIDPAPPPDASQTTSRPPSFDDTVLAAIRRNMRNVESTMLPDDVVTTLGLRSLGTLEKTSRHGRADYLFAGQASRLIVQTVSAPQFVHPPLGIRIPEPIDFQRRISEFVFERSDGTRIRFVPGDVKDSGTAVVEY